MSEENKFESQEYWKNEFIKNNEGTFKAIDDYLEKGIRPKNDEFIFSKVPKILRNSDVSENEIVIKTSVINKARKIHSMTNDEIRSAIKDIASPVLVFKSDTKATENKKNSYLSLTDTFKNENEPIAFSMNLDSDYERKNRIIKVNEIRSLHNRILIARNGTDLVNKWTSEGLCKYVDDKKISEWSKAARVYFPLAVLNSDKNNIKTFSNFVNNQFLDTTLEDKSSININQTKENKTMDETLGLDINTYTLQSGEKLSELPKNELMNYIHSNANLNSSMAVSQINRQQSYATEEESNELGRRAKSVTDAYRERDSWNKIRSLIMNFDSYSRFVAANHLKPNSTEIINNKSGEDVFSKEIENYSQGYEQFVQEVLIPDRSNSFNQTKNNVEENKDNPFIKADPEDVKNLYEQSESVEKMQQKAAENAELDENGNVVFPKEENAAVQSKEPVPKWKETLSNLMNMAKDEEEKENAEDKIKMQNSTEQSKPDIAQEEEKISVSKLPKVSVKSYVSGQEFTGQNPSRAESLRRELVESGTIKPEDDLVLVSEEQLKAAGCSSKSDAKPVSILCPPDEKNPDFHNENYFHISAVDDIEKLKAFYNSHEAESVSENPADYMETSEDVADFGFENDPNYLALEEMNNSYNEYLETEEGKKHLEEEAASAAETKSATNVPPKLSATAMKHKNFVEHAYEAGTKVPSFGYRNSQSGHTVILEGWEFCKTEDFATNAATDSYMNSIRSEFIEDKDGNKVKNPNYNPYKYKDNGQTVVLSKLQKETNPETGLVDEKRIYLRISAAEYNAQIENSCLLKDCAQITNEVKQEYLQKAHLDENEQRPNNFSNFTHNFNAYCRKGANNVKEAMDFGKRLIQNMRPEEREKLKTQMLKWEKLTGKSYTQRLAEEYKENVSDRPITDKTAFTKETLDAIRYNTETISHKGAPLDKSCRMKVGDTIKMKITVPDCLGRRNKKLPIQTLELVSHSPDGNSVVLMDEKHLSKYVIPRDDFIKTVQKQERKQIKAERRADRKTAVSMSD